MKSCHSKNRLRLISKWSNRYATIAFSRSEFSGGCWTHLEYNGLFPLLNRTNVTLAKRRSRETLRPISIRRQMPSTFSDMYRQATTQLETIRDFFFCSNRRGEFSRPITFVQIGRDRIPRRRSSDR